MFVNDYWTDRHGPIMIPAYICMIRWALKVKKWMVVKSNFIYIHVISEFIFLKLVSLVWNIISSNGNSISVAWYQILEHGPIYTIFAYMRFIQQKLRNTLILVSMIVIWFIKCHHFNMEQYIPYSLICDLFSRNLETHWYSYPW